MLIKIITYSLTEIYLSDSKLHIPNLNELAGISKEVNFMTS